MKTRRIVATALAFALLCLGTGCGSAVNAVSGVANAVGNTVGQYITGDVTGEVGKTYSTQWFTFTVKSIEKVSSYAGYTPAADNELIDVLITETCTFDQAIPMGTWDFKVDHDTFEEWYWPMDPINDTMMPVDFELRPNETVEYHMVYEVPAGYTDLKLLFTEFDEMDNEGATFTILIQD